MRAVRLVISAVFCRDIPRHILRKIQLLQLERGQRARDYILLIEQHRLRPLHAVANHRGDVPVCFPHSRVKADVRVCLRHLIILCAQDQTRDRHVHRLEELAARSGDLLVPCALGRIVHTALAGKEGRFLVELGGLVQAIAAGEHVHKCAGHVADSAFRKRKRQLHGLVERAGQIADDHGGRVGVVQPLAEIQRLASDIVLKRTVEARLLARDVVRVVVQPGRISAEIVVELNFVVSRGQLCLDVRKALVRVGAVQLLLQLGNVLRHRARGIPLAQRTCQRPQLLDVVGVIQHLGQVGDVAVKAAERVILHIFVFLRCAVLEERIVLLARFERLRAPRNLGGQLGHLLGLDAERVQTLPQRRDIRLFLQARHVVLLKADRLVPVHHKELVDCIIVQVVALTEDRHRRAALLHIEIFSLALQQREERKAGFLRVLGKHLHRLAFQLCQLQLADLVDLPLHKPLALALVLDHLFKDRLVEIAPDLFAEDHAVVAQRRVCRQPPLRLCFSARRDGVFEDVLRQLLRIALLLHHVEGLDAVVAQTAPRKVRVHEIEYHLAAAVLRDLPEGTDARRHIARVRAFSRRGVSSACIFVFDIPLQLLLLPLVGDQFGRLRPVFCDVHDRVLNLHAELVQRIGLLMSVLAVVAALRQFLCIFKEKIREVLHIQLLAARADDLRHGSVVGLPGAVLAAHLRGQSCDGLGAHLFLFQHIGNVGEQCAGADRRVRGRHFFRRNQPRCLFCCGGLSVFGKLGCRRPQAAVQVCCRLPHARRVSGVRQLCTVQQATA